MAFELREGKKDSDSLCKILKLFELKISVVFSVILINLLKHLQIFFKFFPVSEQLWFSVNFIDLFRFEIIFMFEFANFCNFFIDIPNFLGDSSEEGLVFLIDSLRFVVFMLFVGASFGHYLNNWIKLIFG